MRKLTMLCLSGILLAFAATGFAYPTLLGPTGYAALPSCDATNSFEIAGDFYDTENDSSFPVRALFGGRTWEIGGLFTFNDDANVWGANGKWAIPISSNGKIALGALYTHTDESDENPLIGSINATSVYLAYTHRFTSCNERRGGVIGKGLSGTVGVNWTTIDADDFDNENDFRAYLGADFTFDNWLQIGAEIQSEQSDLGESDPLSSVYVRYPFSNMIAAQVGWTNVSPSGLVGLDDHNFYAGVNLNFGPEETCKEEPGIGY